MANENGTDTAFDLPGSGYEVLTKMLQAYARIGDKEATLDDVAQKSGLGRTQVSANHHFLTSMGILQGGKRKAITPTGKELVVAISHGLESDIAAHWKKILETNSKTGNIIDMVRIQKKTMSVEELRKRIAATLGQAQSGRTTTGVNCLIEILVKAGALAQTNEGFVVPDHNASAKTSISEIKSVERTPKTPTSGNEPALQPTPGAVNIRDSAHQHPSFHIDIQIHISADAKPDQIDQIFASMAKHLYGKD